MVFSLKASDPKAVFPLGVVVLPNAQYPNAVFPIPEVSDSSAATPAAVFHFCSSIKSESDTDPINIEVFIFFASDKSLTEVAPLPVPASVQVSAPEPVVLRI